MGRDEVRENLSLPPFSSKSPIRSGRATEQLIMPFGVSSLAWRVAAGALAGVALLASAASATPYLVVDADSGQVLIQRDAAEVWYPASLTKLMTVYVALDAVRAGKLTMDTPLVVSVRASRAPPSKMGFQPGAEVTLDNAL